LIIIITGKNWVYFSRNNI